MNTNWKNSMKRTLLDGNPEKVHTDTIDTYSRFFDTGNSFVDRGGGASIDPHNPKTKELYQKL